eukprot:14834488-Ditylum_brightwellii.AAC.1
MNALLKVHIHNAVSEPAEWRGMCVTGIIKGLTEEQLSEIADHKHIKTIDYNSSSLTDTEAYIDFYISDHFQTYRALAVALPAWCKTDNVTLSSTPYQSTANPAHMAKTPTVPAKEASATFEKKKVLSTPVKDMIRHKECVYVAWVQESTSSNSTFLGVWTSWFKTSKAVSGVSYAYYEKPKNILTGQKYTEEGNTHWSKAQAPTLTII